jgi:hypothetical protein
VRSILFIASHEKRPSFKLFYVGGRKIYVRAKVVNGDVGDAMDLAVSNQRPGEFILNTIPLEPNEL